MAPPGGGVRRGRPVSRLLLYAGVLGTILSGVGGGLAISTFVGVLAFLVVTTLGCEVPGRARFVRFWVRGRSRIGGGVWLW